MSPRVIVPLVAALFVAVQLGRAQGTPRPIEPPALPDEDCRTYDPHAVKVDRLMLWGGPSLTGRGLQPLAKVATTSDGANAVALAKRYTQQCFVGRRSAYVNRKSKPHDYLLMYWKGATGQATTISPEICFPYVAANLRTVDHGAAGWTLTDGGRIDLKFDGKADASAALTLVRRYTAHCMIGVASAEERLEYWK